MNRELVRQEVPAARGPDGVEGANEIRERHVGRGELLDVAVVAAHPGDRRVVPGLGEDVAGELRDRGERVVVDLATGADGHRLVEQSDERAQNARLRLTPQA